jgi:NAD-dependent DNA ligase
LRTDLLEGQEMAERPSDLLLRRFHGKRLGDRQIDELIGLAHGLSADGVINQQEAEFLRKWLIANSAVADSPLLDNLLPRVNMMLADSTLDAEESRELLETLQSLCGDDQAMEVGELLKSSTLPLDHPPPHLYFEGMRFCFTGTFAFGPRQECEAITMDRGGKTGSLTKGTRYLVVGAYATDSWMHSTYGRKIERAVEMRSGGLEISIVCEDYWKAALYE